MHLKAGKVGRGKIKCTYAKYEPIFLVRANMKNEILI